MQPEMYDRNSLLQPVRNVLGIWGKVIRIFHTLLKFTRLEAEKNEVGQSASNNPLPVKMTSIQLVFANRSAENVRLGKDRKFPLRIHLDSSDELSFEGVRICCNHHAQNKGLTRALNPLRALRPGWRQDSAYRILIAVFFTSKKVFANNANSKLWMLRMLWMHSSSCMLQEFLASNASYWICKN